MKINLKRIVLINFLLVFSSSILSQETTTTFVKLPPLNISRVAKFDIKHLVLDLQFDWPKKQAFGTAFIWLSPKKNINSVTLDAGMLSINKITLANGIQLQFKYDGSDKNDGLEIQLDRNYMANETLCLVIDYHTNWVNSIDPNNLSGTNGKGLRFSQPTSNDPIKPKEIWSFGDPESNRYWFPSYDAPNDLRTTEFIATVDQNLTVISNGSLFETKINANGTKTFHYKMDIPYPNHQTSFVVGEYIDFKQKYQDIELHNFGYPQEKESIQATVVRLPDMIRYFSEKTGVKYPYKTYSQVFVQDIGTFNGNTSFSTITENMVDDYGTHADFYFLWDQTEAEALAQQWFGNYITCDNWSDVWLNKSFSHYFNQLYNEHKNGRDEFLLYQLSFDHSVYLGDWSAGYKHPIVTQNFDNVYNFTNDNYATYRGSLVLHMLRKQLGEEQWWKVVQYYIKSCNNKTVTTQDFQNAVTTITGEKMDWFFDQWIYKMGHPVFEITKKYDEVTKKLTINVKQTQTIDIKNEYPQANLFQGTVAIEIDGKIVPVTIKPQLENVFIIPLLKKPNYVNFDYESSWIKEIKFEKSIDELLYQLENSKDALARQTAMQELGTVAKNEKVSSILKEKISIALQKIIASNAYWRLRIGAMSQLRSIISSHSEKIDNTTIKILLKLIENEKSYIKGVAINFLGMTKEEKYVPIYIKALNDPSDRVISFAAIALGKTKSPKAFEALAKLANRPSMKSQSLLSVFSGLQALGDSRGFDIAFKALSDLTLPRWRLPNGSVWDYRIFAAQTIASLDKSKEAYPLILERLKKSTIENDLDGMLNNLLIINTLAYPDGQEAYDLLKVKFKDNPEITMAITQYENQFKESLNQKK
jgi:aminopeptidase N